MKRLVKVFGTWDEHRVGGWLLGLAVAVSVWACLMSPVEITLEAQTLPITKTLAWDPNPAADAVTNYTVRQDGVVLGNPTGTTQAVTFTTVGTHTLTVTATNLWGTSAPATLVVNVVVPAVPGNMRLQ